MGFALAEAAVALGNEVTLVAGPVNVDTPKGVKRIDVVSCEEMRRQVMRRARRADVVIMAAAIADARPQRYSKKKLKKPLASIRLTPTPDILAELGAIKKDDQVLVGFALETEALIANATRKMRAKNCDWMVANKASALGAHESKATLIPRRGRPIALPLLPKHDLAVLLLSHILT